MRPREDKKQKVVVQLFLKTYDSMKIINEESRKVEN